jgi:hypothetical protein
VRHALQHAARRRTRSYVIHAIPSEGSKAHPGIELGDELSLIEVDATEL